MASSSRPADLHIANALRLAKEDLDAAKLLTAAGNRFGAYHLQQCGEKLLLALLTAEGQHAERKDSHRLDVLLDKLPSDNPFRQRFAPLTILTMFATTYRYPKDGGRLPPMPDEARMLEWADALGGILNDAALHFGVDLAASDRLGAARTDPPRL
ncbi:HEPN domain-containing protein [Mangrovicella endophytica]|uniref:HEPN domain-containing protein n=1 Tax=Mangrovicella endophytica TaxID=2066697 RepID=UPI000C9DCA1C|nr:HEPN domain-containing protein [Mangrovicella endophytica]